MLFRSEWPAREGPARPARKIARLTRPGKGRPAETARKGGRGKPRIAASKSGEENMEVLHMREDFPAVLIEAVEAAIERLNRPGVEGWGLRVFGGMQDAGDMVTLTPHDGHPPAPERRWIPKVGRLVELGEDWEDDDTLLKYYAHIVGPNDVRYVLLVAPRFYHAEARYIGVDEVPEWVLARLAEEAAV